MIHRERLIEVLADGDSWPNKLVRRLTILVSIILILLVAGKVLGN